MIKFNNYHPSIKFTYELNKRNVIFLKLNGSLSGNKLTADLHTTVKLNINVCIIDLHT